MKSLKVAAVLAGSLIAVGVTAPAYAAESTDLASTGLDTGLRTAVPFELMPLHESDSVVGADEDSLLGTTKEAAAVVNEAKPVHGNVGLRA